MTSHEHLQMLINRAYFEDEAVYRALMAQRDAEIQAAQDWIEDNMPGAAVRWDDQHFAARSKTAPCQDPR